MNNCAVCDGCFRNDHPNKVICDGICRQSFHAECANFSKDALSCYREMPNLQWFCDGCIFQSRSSNVSPSQFSKFSSTAVSPTSLPSYMQRTLTVAKVKRSRNRNPVSNARSNDNNSVFLASKSANAERDVMKADGAMSSSPSANLKRPVDRLVKSPSVRESGPLTTCEITQSDVSLLETPRNTAGFELTHKEPSESKTPPAGSSSSVNVLTKSSVSPQVSSEGESPTVRQRYTSIDSRVILAPSEIRKVAYVSNFDPSVTEKHVVSYLLRKNVISSAEDVSCQILVSPNADMSTVTFVSFRISVNSETFHSIVNSELWPDGIVAREFVRR